MKVIIHDFHTDIFLAKEEVSKYCQPGKGAETCIWLVCGRQGFECLALNKPFPLVARLGKGETNAKREGDLTGCRIPRQARQALERQGKGGGKKWAN